MSQQQKELKAENSRQREQQVQKPRGKKKLSASSSGEGRPERLKEPTVRSGVGEEGKVGQIWGGGRWEGGIRWLRFYPEAGAGKLYL